jgi:hypothetical protein
MDIEYFSIKNSNDSKFKTLSKIFEDYTLVKTNETSYCLLCETVIDTDIIHINTQKRVGSFCKQCNNITR